MADDAAVYAIDWLVAATSTDEATRFAIQAAKNRAETAIRAGIFPPGLNDDYASTGGLLHQASFSVPGTGFFPSAQIYDTGDLPYGDPPNATAGHSSSGVNALTSTTEASGSSGAPNPAPAQVPMSGPPNVPSTSNKEDKVDFDAMMSD